MTKKEFLKGKALEAYRRAEEKGTLRLLIDVAASHGISLTPDGCQAIGVTPNTPVAETSGGMNGKRPYYAMLSNSGSIVTATGTYFGNQSGFHFTRPKDLPEIRLSDADRTRLNFLPDADPDDNPSLCIFFEDGDGSDLLNLGKIDLKGKKVERIALVYSDASSKDFLPA